MSGSNEPGLEAGFELPYLATLQSYHMSACRVDNNCHVMLRLTLSILPDRWRERQATTDPLVPASRNMKATLLPSTLDTKVKKNKE